MKELVAGLYAFADKYMYWLDFPHIQVIDIVEIIIIAVALYYFLVWIKNTRAWTLLKGILILLVFLVIAAMFQMSTILWLFKKLLNFALIALIVIFQPELRRGLERIGRARLTDLIFHFTGRRGESGYFSERVVEEIVSACYDMSRERTGALIVMEREVRLNEYIGTGITLDSAISSQLLLNVFEKNTPLHDGAVIVRDSRIVSATCYLPLSDNVRISKTLGTRHRAAIGISEVSDAWTIVVSEETGAVSLTAEGQIYEDLDEMSLRRRLLGRDPSKEAESVDPSKKNKKRRRKDAKMGE